MLVCFYNLGTYNFCRNFDWFKNFVYYIDSKKDLFKFDVGKVAEGRVGGSDLVLDGECIDQNIEEVAVDSKIGTVYTLQSTGVVGKIGSNLSRKP